MLLDTPTLVQTRDYDCGAVAVDIVASHYGLTRRGPARLANRVDGMAPDTVAAVLRALGLRVLAGPMLGAVGDLQHYTRIGCPILCPITQDAGGHWTVVRGVERGRVQVQCPTSGRVSYSAREWLDRWRDMSTSGHLYDRWGIVCGAP